MKHSLVEINNEIIFLNKDFEKMNNKFDKQEKFTKDFKYLMKLFFLRYKLWKQLQEQEN